jgi:hypothetical protein
MAGTCFEGYKYKIDYEHKCNSFVVPAGPRSYEAVIYLSSLSNSITDKALYLFTCNGPLIAIFSKLVLYKEIGELIING